MVMEGAAILSSLASAAQSPPRGVGEVVGMAASVPPDLQPSADPSSQVRGR